MLGWLPMVRNGVLSPHAPLWRNPNLPQFFAFEEPVVWMKFGMKKIDDVTTNGQLKSFNELKSLHQLPNTHFFCYIQLRHAYQTQFKQVRVSFSGSALKSMLREDDLQSPYLLSISSFSLRLFSS